MIKINSIFRLFSSLLIIISIILYVNNIGIFTENADYIAYENFDSEKIQHLIFTTISKSIFEEVLYLKILVYIILQSCLLLHLLSKKFYSFFDLCKFLCLGFSLNIIIIHFSFVITRAGLSLAILLITFWAMQLRLIGAVIATMIHYKSAPLMLLIIIVNWSKRHKNLISVCILLSVLIGVVTLSKFRGEHLYSSFHPIRFTLLVIVPMILLMLNYQIKYIVNDFMFKFYFLFLVFYVFGYFEYAGEALSRMYAAIIIGYYIFCNNERHRTRIDIVWILLVTSLLYIRGWENFASS